MELRYTNKGALIEYDLDVRLFEAFDLKVSDIVPLKNGYLIYSDRGKMLLKQMDYSDGKLEFINKALEYIGKTYNSYIKPLQTKDESISKVWKGREYIIFELKDNIQCDMGNIDHLKASVKSIANMHKASLGILNYISNDYYELLKENSSLTFSIEQEEEAFDKLKKYKEWTSVYVYKNQVDKVFLNYVDYYMNNIKKSLAILKNYSYEDLCRERDKISLCHGDINAGNITLDENLQAYLMNFHLSTIDLRIKDLCNLVDQEMKYEDFDLTRIQMILSVYNSINSLQSNEIQVIYGFLKFPTEFFEIARDYYEKRNLWEEEVVLDKMLKYINLEDKRERLLEGLRSFRL